MNHLSWIIYLIEVVSNLSSFLTFVSLGSMILSFGIVLCFTMSINEAFGDNKTKIPGWIKTRQYYGKLFAMLAIICWLITTFIPQKQTMLLIASSEIGEQIINNPQIQSIADPSLDLLKAWIKKETNDLNKGESK